MRQIFGANFSKMQRVKKQVDPKECLKSSSLRQTLVPEVHVQGTI